MRNRSSEKLNNETSDCDLAAGQDKDGWSFLWTWRDLSRNVLIAEFVGCVNFKGPLQSVFCCPFDFFFSPPFRKSFSGYLKFKCPQTNNLQRDWWRRCNAWWVLRGLVVYWSEKTDNFSANPGFGFLSRRAVNAWVNCQRSSEYTRMPSLLYLIFAGNWRSTGWC